MTETADLVLHALKLVGSLLRAGRIAGQASPSFWTEAEFPTFERKRLRVTGSR
jgi:hypothetical protein